MSNEVEKQPAQEDVTEFIEQDELTEDMLETVVGGTMPTGVEITSTQAHGSGGGAGAGLIPAV